MKKYLPFLLWFFRLGVGLLFIFSGLIKANDTIGFAYKLEEYFELFGMPFLKTLAWSISAFICVLEIALGAAILVGYKFVESSWLLLVMIIFFTFLTGYSAITGKVTDCGCFGDAIPLTPWQSFYKDLILFVGIVILFIGRKTVTPWIGNKLSGGITWGLSILSSVFVAYTVMHLPVMDFRAYKPGTDLKKCTTEYIESEGKIKCKDYFPFKIECGEDEFAGNTLMIISYDLEKADEEGLKNSVTLFHSLAGTPVKVIGGTGSGGDIRDAYKLKYSIPYCLSPQDMTMLKTMIRANPGFILLKEGRVKKMWHYNDIPDKAAVLQALSY
ncbi:MAG: DoxX family protein [Sphingobacteriia bacterium]|nr:DoxX family protein [Sphingobacteriia bacterium]